MAFSSDDLTPNMGEEFTEEIWADEHIVYLKSGAKVTPEGLTEHYARLAKLQPQFELNRIDTFIIDFRSLQGDVPYLTLIDTAQKARKQIDPEFLKHTLRVFIIHEGYGAMMLQLWGRLTAHFTAVRFCTTLERAHDVIDDWRKTRS